MSALTGDFLSMAEACGERTHARAYVAGVDFDPSDPDDVEAVRLASERDRFDRIAELERENAELRRIVDRTVCGYPNDTENAHDHAACLDALDEL